LICVPVSYPCERQTFVLDLPPYGHQEDFRLGSNMVNKISPVKSIGVEDLVNSIDSLCVPEDYKRDCVNIIESRRHFQDLRIKNKSDPGISSLKDNSNSSSIRKKCQTRFLAFTRVTKSLRDFSVRSIRCYQASVCGTARNSPG
jgi:hypothetical protein